MSKIQKYEPMMVATLRNGRQLLYPKSKDPELKIGLQNQTFVMIEGVRINKFEIATMEDLKPDYDVLIGQPEDVRSRLMARIKEYETNIGQRPPRDVKVKMLEKILKTL